MTYAAIVTVVFAIALTAAVTDAAAGDGLRVVDPKCEFATNPLGVDVPRPRLSWQVASDQRGQKQTAYHVLVATSPAKLDADQGDLWDSGRVGTDQTAFVEYDGERMNSSQQLFWKVRVWDRDGAPSAWSEAASWTMGLATAEDWMGGWILGPRTTESLLLRKEFTVKPGLRRAIVHATGLGQYELRFNGQRAGEDLLTPGWTNYNRVVLYDTQDVTPLLKPGANAIGVVLGNGMYNVVRRHRFAKFTGSFGPLRALLHLRLEYEDGRVEFVGTDDTWRIHPGPITYNSIYGGEDYDARLDPAGWDSPGFDDRAWERAVRPVRPEMNLRGLSGSPEPVRAIETRKPVKSHALADGKVVYDFGQNTSFMPRIKVSGPAGSTVKLTPSEILNPDGSLQRMTMGSQERGSSWWQYTKATDAEETWFPRFYYLGSRYVQVECLPAREGSAAPKLESIEMVIVHAAAAPAGEFETSDLLINQIRDMVRWSQRSNMVSLLTDCPHREKLGWLEQTHLNGPALRYEWDMARLFGKTMRDISEAQLGTGAVPNIAPEYTEFRGHFRTAAEWGASFISIPWQQYEFVGDRQLLDTHYAAMKRYFAYLETRAVENIISNDDDTLGDWYDYGPRAVKEPELTPPANTATAFFFQNAAILSQAAKVLGHTEDAAAFTKRAEEIRAAYNAKFFDESAGAYKPSSQTSNAIPLAMGIVEPAQRQRVQAALAREIERAEYALNSGGIGTRYVLVALGEAGRSDLVYRVLHNADKPGYAFLVKQGETAMTEAWDGRRGASHNHFMLGQVNEWLYRYLAGIDRDPSAQGFKKIVIRPNPVGDLAWVRASYQSIEGKIALRWEKRGDAFALDVTIPPNTTATVHLPARQSAKLYENGAALESAAGVKLLKREADRAVLAVESGSYHFEAR